jgi:hypothetical protein
MRVWLPSDEPNSSRSAMNLAHSSSLGDEFGNEFDPALT